MMFINLYSKAIKISTKVFKITIILLVLANSLAPIVVFIWPKLISHFIFQNAFTTFSNLSNPNELGLNQTYPFRLSLNDHIHLGAWHVLPKGQEIPHTDNLESHFKQSIKPNSIIVIYMHGSFLDRAFDHRIQLCSILRNLGFHVVSFDYRGYGDSSGEPSEDGLLEDVLNVYETIKANSPSSSKIFLWGHSLGAAVCAKLARVLTEKKQNLQGLILEAPFLNLKQEIYHYPFTRPFYFNYFLHSQIDSALSFFKLEFRSDLHLQKVSAKIAIIHAEDDLIVPIGSGFELYETVLKNGISKELIFNRIPWYLNCGHILIYKNPNFLSFVKKFIN